MHLFIMLACVFALTSPAVTSAQQEVRFAGSDEALRGPLVGLLIEPAGSGPFPAVVLLHGCGGTSPRDKAWAARLTAWGFSVLHLDSLSPRGFKSVCTNPGLLSPVARAKDVHAARAYLASLPAIRKDRIAVLGWSHGAWTTLAALHNAPASQPSPGSFQAAVAFYPYCLDVLNNATTPLLILIGERDTWTPARRCRHMRIDGGSTVPQPVIKVYPEATHGFDYDAPERVVAGHRIAHDKAATEDAIARVKEFLEKYLR